MISASVSNKGYDFSKLLVGEMLWLPDAILELSDLQSKSNAVIVIMFRDMTLKLLNGHERF